MRLLSILAVPLLLISTVLASAPDLYTSSISYCTQPEVVFLGYLDISYWRANESITFDFQIASVDTNLNTSVNVYVNVYGRHVVNTTVDLCSILYGVLCPLPQVNFTGK